MAHGRAPSGTKTPHTFPVTPLSCTALCQLPTRRSWEHTPTPSSPDFCAQELRPRGRTVPSTLGSRYHTRGASGELCTRASVPQTPLPAPGAAAASWGEMARVPQEPLLRPDGPCFPVMPRPLEAT